MVAAAFVGFLISTLFGVGGAMVLIPALLVEVPAAQAVALASPVMLLNNSFKVAAFRRHLDTGAAWRVMLTAVPAASVGALYADAVDEVWLRRGIAALIVSSVALQRVGGLELQFGPRRLIAAGAFIGATSGLCGAAGGPTVVAMRGYGLVKEGFVATIAALAVGLQLGKIPSYAASGLLGVERVPVALLLAVSAVVAVLLGRRWLAGLDVKRFKLLLDVMLLIIAGWLLLS